MSEDATPAVRPRLRIMRIIHGALLVGCISFAVIAIFLRRQGMMPTPEQPIISLVGLIVAATTLLVLLILPGVLASSWRKKVAAGVNPLSAASPVRVVSTSPSSRSNRRRELSCGGRCIRPD